MENKITFWMQARQKRVWNGDDSIKCYLMSSATAKINRISRINTYSFVKTDYRPQATAQCAAAAQTATKQPFYIDGEILS